MSRYLGAAREAALMTARLAARQTPPPDYEADPRVWPCPDGPYCRLGCRPLEVTAP